MRLYGKNSVIEKLRANPQEIKQIYVCKEFHKKSFIHKKAQKNHIPVYVVSRSKIQKMAQSKNAQGIIAILYDYAYTPYDELIENALKQKKSILFLDGLNDPQNLGAIIRSLACLGKFSLVLPTHHSVSITEAVLRIASGGDNYVSVAKVPNINKAIKKAQTRGFWVAGSVVDGGEPILDVTMQFPLGLVIGSEQKGMRGKIKDNVDCLFNIPMQVETLSFNVAHATTILCYEITRQKKLFRRKKA
jgi:23S rRNA (guanosine2251-2'-O)-methyltransferase